MNYIHTPLLIIAFFAFGMVSCHSDKRTQYDKSPTEESPHNCINVSSPIELQSVKITSRDGLPDNSVRKIYQDRKGFIWFATMNGLSRYDGTSFVTFRKGEEGVSLQDNRVRSIVEDHNGNLWISTTSDMFSCYNLSKDQFIDYTGNGDLKRKLHRITISHDNDVWLWDENNGAMTTKESDGKFTSTIIDHRRIGTNSVYFVKPTGKEKAWLGTPKGLFFYDNGSLRLIADKPNLSIARSLAGFYYFISSDGTILKVKGLKVLSSQRLPISQGEKIRNTLIVNGNIMIFTNSSSYTFHPQTLRTVKNQGEWDIANAEIHTDNKGGKWIANGTGILRMVDGNNLIPFQLMPTKRVGFIDHERYSIVRDSRGLIWITTYGNGMFVYNPKTKIMQHFTASADTNAPIASNYIQSIMEDRSGSLWIGAEYVGLSHLWLMNEDVRRVFPERTGHLDRSNTIRMITAEANGDIVVGTRTGGLYTYDPTVTELRSKEYYDANIYASCLGPDGTFWKGTREKGLIIGDKNYEKGNRPGSLSDNRVFSIVKDKHNRMWIGTFGGGLNLAIPHKDGTYTFRQYLNEDNINMDIRCLFIDKNGWIWTGTNGGLIIFNPDRLINNKKEYFHYTSENSQLLTNEVRFITQDSKGRVWMAMPGSGIATCSVDEGGYGKLEFKSYGQNDGLVSNMAQAVVEDRNGSLWISTELGLSRFNPSNKVFETYFFSQYIIGNVYSQNSARLLSNGNVLFGTEYGMVIIDPAKVPHEKEKANVTFTDLKVNGMSVRPSDSDSPIELALPYEDHINLAHSQNSFSISFSTFDYSDNNETKYSYVLDRYDKGWSTPSTTSSASYKNLPSGTYTLRVKACNSLGTWGDESVIKITVNPPLYLSVWAFIIYITIIVIVGYFILKTFHNINTLRNRIKLEAELTKYKLKFFTNIAHEFRTPLTLIQGSTEKVLYSKGIPEELAVSVSIIDKSTKRMLRLINQLLEFRKMQNDKLELALEKTDAIALLRGIYDSFRDAAESKQIEYDFESSETSREVFLDSRHIDKIVYNLLSNAFKYTPSHGRISLITTFNDKDKTMTIKVTDTGVGISKDKQKELFSRFMQSNYIGDSFGIGLHLTHELVAVHHGTIEYKENAGGGSAFIVTIPTDESVYDKDDFLVADNILMKEEADMTKARMSQVNSTDDKATVTPLNKKKILLIEDDNDIRDFISTELRHYFEVEVAADGKSGLDKAKTYDADLIISDVMMPGMNGFELTRKLKDSFETSHIPIILLTALDSQDNELEGVESGADMYITKPFSPKLLLAKIFNIIEQRDKLKQKFTNDINAMRPTLCSSKQDKVFLEKMTRILEDKYGEPKFTVDMFADLMHIGRTAFFRKVKGVTGYTPNEYIRVIRMKKAAEFLDKNEMTVSEIAYRVGIDDPFYFSKMFKKQFGVSPTAYQKGERSNANSTSNGDSTDSKKNNETTK